MGLVHLELVSVGYNSASALTTEEKVVFFSERESTTTNFVDKELIDGSFSISPPRLGRDGQYAPRTVRFSFRLRAPAGISEDYIFAELSRIANVVALANDPYHRENIGYASGMIEYGDTDNDIFTGMRGTVLAMSVSAGDVTVSGNMEGGAASTTTWGNRVYAWNVIRGHIEHPALRFSDVELFRDEQGGFVLDAVDVELTVEPTCISAPYVRSASIYNINTLAGTRWYPYGGMWYSFYLDMKDVAPVKTGMKMYITHETGSAIIVSRFAGNPIWEFPGYPIQTVGTTTPPPFFVTATTPLETPTNLRTDDYLMIDCDGVGNFRYARNSTAAWSNYIPITVNEAISLNISPWPGGVSQPKITFTANPSSASTWKIPWHQYELNYTGGTASLEPTTATPDYFENGVSIAKCWVNVPVAARGRYYLALLHNTDNGVMTEWRAKVKPVSVGRYSSSPSSYPNDGLWRAVESNAYYTPWVAHDSSGYTDGFTVLTVLDFTAFGNPLMMNPRGHAVFEIEIFVRTHYSAPRNNAYVNGIMLLSAQDDVSTFVGVWGESLGRIVLSSLDIDNPYVGSVFITDEDISGLSDSYRPVSVLPMSAFGVPPALVGGVRNYVVVRPMRGSMYYGYRSISDPVQQPDPNKNILDVYVQDRLLYPRY